MSQLDEKNSTVPSSGSVIESVLLCGQQLTLFIHLVTDVLDLRGMFLLVFWGKHPVKCIIMGRAVDILLAENHTGINNHRSTVQSSIPFLTRCLAGLPESKVELGRSAVYVHWKHPQTGCVCNYLYLTDLEAQQSMVTMLMDWIQILFRRSRYMGKTFGSLFASISCTELEKC